MNKPTGAAARPWWQTMRSAWSLAAVLALIHLARARDVFTDFTRPTVSFALNLFGMGAVDHGTTISVGRLEVPWTRDCAGLNLLMVLVALTIWVNRTAPVNARYWLKIALTVPAALLANVLRVLSLIAYREVFFPSVESPQLHYFLGLVWLLPFMGMVVPRGERPISHLMVEALQAASVVALLAPMSGVPGGDATTMAAVVCLAQGKVQSDALGLRSLLTLLWMAAAAGITLIGMESMWMPWLLLCPVLVSRQWILSPEGLVLTLSTHPLLGMLPGGVWIIWLALGLACWRWLKPAEGSSSSPLETAIPQVQRCHIKPLGASLCFVLPFIASTLLARDHHLAVPPQGATVVPIAADAFEVRLQDQPSNIGLLWFNPSGNGRHHTLVVCMKYRGVELVPSTENANVFTDGNRWMREFYLVDELLVPTYAAYLRKTFRPRSSAGVHLIFAAKREAMSAQEFNASCEELAARVYEKGHALASAS